MDNDAAVLVTGGDDDHKDFIQQWLDTNETTSVDFAGTCAGEQGIDREEGLASRFYSTCLREFQQLCRQERKRYAHGSRSYLLKEELDKLYMWGESFGPGELDKALDESDELRDNVLDLLVNLGELVICELRASSTVAPARQIHDLESFIKQARLTMSDVDGQVGLDALAGDATSLDRDDCSDDDVHDFCEDIVFTIKCLTELGPSLEHNLASAGRSDASISKSAFVLFCLSGPAGFYVSLVRDKFKQASKELVERLGEANWQRHSKVRNMMGDPEKNPNKGQETARSVFQPDMTFHDSGIGTSVPARTQYAPSHTSFRTSNTEGRLKSMRVLPTPPEAIDGKPFRCYLCGDMVSPVRTRTQWKMHAFSDLMPYICTFDGCQHKLSCFPSRSAWANHEFQEHRFDRYWACPECPRKSCSALDWEHHLGNVHNRKFSGPDLVSARNAACRISPKRAEEEEECLLCRVVLGKPHRAFVKHVCQHMEDIALMALPSNADEDSDIGSISTNRTSNEDNNTSKDLHIDKDCTIKCICGFGDNDGIIVCCERCDTWQHIECYYHDEKLVPNKGIFGSINHSCVDCKPRLLDSSVAIKRQVNRRAEIGPHSLSKQPNEQHPNAPLEKLPAQIMSPNDTSDYLIRYSPQVESSPRPMRISEEGDESTDEDEVKSAHASDSNSEESTDEDRVGSKNGSGSAELLRTAVPEFERGIAPKFRRHDPSSNESTEARFLETPNLVKQDPQDLRPQEPVKETRRSRRRFNIVEKEQVVVEGKIRACDDCRKAKRKCPHVTPKSSMGHKKHTNSPAPFTSPTVSANGPLPQDHQTTESTHEALGWGSLVPYGTSFVWCCCNCSNDNYMPTDPTCIACSHRKCYRCAGRSDFRL